MLSKVSWYMIAITAINALIYYFSLVAIYEIPDALCVYSFQ